MRNGDNLLIDLCLSVFLSVCLSVCLSGTDPACFIVLHFNIISLNILYCYFF